MHGVRRRFQVPAAGEPLRHADVCKEYRLRFVQGYSRGEYKCLGVPRLLYRLRVQEGRHALALL